MRFFAVLLAAMILTTPAQADAPRRLHVVASFSILGDMVKNIAGDDIDLKVLVGANEDTHVYEPTPQDVQTIANADIVIVNGFGFEGWLVRLLKAADYKGKLVVATKDIPPLAFNGDNKTQDPHAWQTAKNGILYIKTILDALVLGDTVHAVTFTKNANNYIAQLEAMDKNTKLAIAKIPESKRVVITTHDAFGHFAAYYGVRFVAPMGVTTEGEPKAGDIARLIDQMRSGKVKALFMENITDKRLIEQLSTETGAYLGGTLYSDALSPVGGAGESYIKLLDNNAKLLIEGMAHNQ